MGRESRLSASLTKESWVIVLAVAAHLAIAVPLAAVLNLWHDEVHTMNSISGSISWTLERASGFEMQPPLYFLIMNLWGKVGSSVFFLRLFSVLSVGLAIGMTARLSKCVFSALPPIWLTLALALNPYAIWASTEIRLYGFLVLLTSALLLTFWQGFILKDKYAKKNRIFFLIISVMAVYTQYYTAFLLASLFLVPVLLRKWASLKKLAFYYVLAAAAVSPLLASALRQTEEHTKFISADNGIMNYLSVLTRFLRYPLRLEWAPPTIYILAYVSILGCLFALTLKYRRRLGDGQRLVGIIVIVLTFFFVAALPLVNHELVNITHTTVLLLPSLLLLIAALDLLPFGSRRKAALISFSVMALANIGYMIGEYSPMAKPGDSRRIARYIEAKERPGQPILVFISEFALPLEYYYSGHNTIIPIPESVSETQYDLNAFAVKGEQDITKALSRVAKEPDQIWLVTWGLCNYLGVDYHCEILEEFAKSHFIVIEDKRFRFSRMRLLQRINEL